MIGQILDVEAADLLHLFANLRHGTASLVRKGPRAVGAGGRVIKSLSRTLDKT
jgi:hypothetical protein